MGTIIRAGDCYFDEQILFTAVAKALSTAYYNPTTGSHAGQVARGALIGLESNDLRFKIDGGTPATNCGMIFAAGDYLMLDTVHQIQNFKGINTGASSSTATVFYFF